VHTPADTILPMAESSKSLTARSLSALKWSYLGVIARVASQLVVQITLARLLGPDTMGLFAMAILIVGVSSIFAEMGMGSALIQKEAITEEDIRSAFTRTVAAGLFMALVVAAIAPLLSAFFADSRMTEVLWGMAPVLVMQSLAVTPMALLKRDLAFKAVQLIQISAYLFGFLAVGLVAALLGAGIWSLVAAWTSQALAAALLLFIFRRHSIKPLFATSQGRLDGFAFRVLANNIANWTIENIDNLLVGRLFGALPLGLYSVSYNLVRAPANHLVASIQAVLFPATSRAQNNSNALHRAYLTTVSVVGLVALPLFLGTAAVADTVVLALFGDRWVGASAVLTPLAIAMALHALMAVAGPVLWGRGRPGLELRVQIWVALGIAIGIWVAGQYSVVAVSWVVCFVYGLRLIAMTYLLAHAIELSTASIFRCLRGGIAVAVLVVIVLLGLEHALAATTPLLLLTMEVASALLCSVAALFSAPRIVLSRELTDLGTVVLAGRPRLANIGLIQRLLAAHQSPSKAKS
jgi:lipopolysaccharide exporter